MDEHTVNKQHMDALKALSDTNLKVSEARALLTELEETETKYLVLREEKAMSRIRESVEASRLLINEIGENYSAVQDITKTVCGFVEYLREANVSFYSLLESFAEKSDAWDVKVEAQHAEIEDMRKQILAGKTQLSHEKESLGAQFLELETKTKVLRDREGVVDRNTQRVVRQELGVQENTELLKTKETHLTAKANALVAKEAQLNDREESIKANEERLDKRERAITDKYASLQKTLTELSK